MKARKIMVSFHKNWFEELVCFPLFRELKNICFKSTEKKLTDGFFLSEDYPGLPQMSQMKSVVEIVSYCFKVLQLRYISVLPLIIQISEKNFFFTQKTEIYQENSHHLQLKGFW